MEERDQKLLNVTASAEGGWGQAGDHCFSLPVSLHYLIFRKHVCVILMKKKNSSGQRLTQSPDSGICV